MPKIWRIILSLLCFSPVVGQVAPPVLEWHFAMGGSADDWGEDIQVTSDGGYITTGATGSTDGESNFRPFYGFSNTDVWVLKYDVNRRLEWKKRFGGEGNEAGVQIKELPGGGYIVLGQTNFNSFDVSGNHGGIDIWLVRLDNAGNIVWKKCLGGSSDDVPGSIALTSSGGFIISGHTASNNGDVSGNHGAFDVWVVEVDASANIIWQRCYGGSNMEGRGYIKPVSGGGFVFTAGTNSTDGDVTENNPNDIWVVRLNAAGGIVWEKCYGGSQEEKPCDVLTLPGAFVIGGTTKSSDWSINNHGQSDAWILKTDLSGNLIWQEAIGGSFTESGNAIAQAADGGFLMAGGTNSLYVPCSQNSVEDFWIIKTNAAGKLLWQKTQGGSEIDYATAIAEGPDGSIYVTGYEISKDVDVVGHFSSSNPIRNPSNDQWILIFGYNTSDLTATLTITSSLTTICPGKPVKFTADPENEGLIVGYTWYVNDVVQPLFTKDTFATDHLNEGDLVKCMIISRRECMLDQEVVSNTIVIHVYPNGKPSGFLPPAITKCVNLYEKIIPLSTFDKYLWCTGATTPTITISRPGNYWLEVTDVTGCSGREYTNVTTKSCMTAVYIPTAFSPNNDGKNDTFKPLVDGKILRYDFTVYNRWGQVVFRTTEINNGWNGRVAGLDQDANVYVWTCNYQLEGQPLVSEKGTVMLVR